MMTSSTSRATIDKIKKGIRRHADEVLAGIGDSPMEKVFRAGVERQVKTALQCLEDQVEK